MPSKVNVTEISFEETVYGKLSNLSYCEILLVHLFISQL